MSTGKLPALRELSIACRRALQWRLLVLWLLAQALPVLLSILPLWAAVAATLDRSPLARQLVKNFDAAVYMEAWSSLPRDGRALNPVGATLVLVLLLPWLSGTLLTAAGNPQRPSFATLVCGGLAQYWRMCRLWLWAMLVFGLAIGAGAGVLSVADGRVDKLALAADADRLMVAARSGAALLFLMAQATVDGARAQLVLEPARRSVVLAWGRACLRLMLRPRLLLLYLAISVAGLSAAALFVYLRLRTPAAGALGVSCAIVLSATCAASLVWMRCARVFALVGSEVEPASDATALPDTAMRVRSYSSPGDETHDYGDHCDYEQEMQ